MMTRSDHSANDLIAAMRAAGDQSKASVKDLAERLGVFRKQLIIEGFKAEDADEMSMGLLGLILGKELMESLEGDDDDEG